MTRFAALVVLNTATLAFSGCAGTGSAGHELGLQPARTDGQMASRSRRSKSITGHDALPKATPSNGLVAQSDAVTAGTETDREGSGSTNRGATRNAGNNAISDESSSTTETNSNTVATAAKSEVRSTSTTTDTDGWQPSGKVTTASFEQTSSGDNRTAELPLVPLPDDAPGDKTPRAADVAPQDNAGSAEQEEAGEDGDPFAEPLSADDVPADDAPADDETMPLEEIELNDDIDPRTAPAPAPTLVDSLSLVELERIALSNNPTLTELALSVEKARGIRQQVGLCPNPTVGYFGEEIGANGTAGIQGGFISQTFVTGGKLELNEAVSSYDVRMMTWELESQRYRVLTDVRSRFYEVLGAQRRLEIAEELVNVARDGVETAEALLADVGTRPDVLQSQVDLNEIRIIYQDAQYDYEAAWKRLASVLGQPNFQPIRLQGTLETETDALDWEATYQRLLAASPELQAARARVGRARMKIRRQEVQPIPNLQTRFAAAHSNAIDDEVAGVQVGIPLPIFNRNQGNIRVAMAEYHRAVQDVERLRLSLRERLAAAFRDYLQAHNRVKRYEGDILPSAQENLDLTTVAYEQGEFDFLRVLTARRTFYEANLRYVTALIALRQAQVAIDGLLLSGALDEVSDVSPNILGGLGQRDQALGGQ